MRVLVCGGREFADKDRLYRILTRLHEDSPLDLIIHGGALGADSLAGSWAWVNAVPCLIHPAHWSRDGKAAGPKRNAAMLKWEPDMVVAFPGGVGTEDMVRRANAAGIRVRRVKEQVEKRA